VLTVSPAPREAWQEILAADADAMPTQTPQWLDAICSGRGWSDASRLYRLPSGRRLLLPLAARAVAGVPLVEESWPYSWSYGGLLAEGGPPSLAEIAMVVEDLRRRMRLRWRVQPSPLHAATWDAAVPARVARVPYRTQIVDLDAGPGSAASRFHRTARYKVHKAERDGVKVERQELEPFMTGFDRLYTQSVDRWARQRNQPLPLARLLGRLRARPRQLARATRTLGQASELWTASYRGEPVAMDVVLVHGRHALYWLGVVDPELSRTTGGTQLLKATIFDSARRRGVRWFNLGESDVGGGVEAYKLKLGASSYDYHAYQQERLPLSRAAALSRRALTGLLGLGQD
jgi:CelD/BcsL family acetyltransferase involved in cellulose biosynthesis